MNTPISTVEPNIDHQTLQMVAELLACVDPDPARRKQHRITKLASFPAEHQERVRDITNRVIEARTRSNAHV